MNAFFEEREEKLILCFGDCLVWQVALISSFFDLNVIGKIIFLIFFVVRMVINCVIMFFLWSNKRVEEYSENYESNGILMFVIVFFLQNLINLLYVLKLVSRKYVFVALAIYIFSFSWERVKGRFGNNTAQWDEQFKADVSTLLMLECLNMFCVLGLLTIISSVQRFVCTMMAVMFINMASSAVTFRTRNRVLRVKERYIWYEMLGILFYLCEMTAGIFYQWVGPDSDKNIVLIIFVLMQMLVYMAVLKRGTDLYRKSLYNEGSI